MVICAASAVFLFLSVQASSIRSATTTGNAAAADINNNNITDTSGNSILDVVKVNNSNNNNNNNNVTVPFPSSPSLDRNAIDLTIDSLVDLEFAPRIVGGEMVRDQNEYPYFGTYIIYNTI